MAYNLGSLHLQKGFAMAEMHVEEHASPIKTPGQLIAVVIVAFLGPILLIILLTQYLTGGLHGLDGEDPAAVAKRIKPVGEVNLVLANGPHVEKSGEEVVKGVCTPCHGAGLLNAPKIGDKAGWAPRVAQGDATLISHALKGIRAMPARGGNAELSDLEVSRATVWMANQAGAGFKEPAGK